MYWRKKLNDGKASSGTQEIHNHVQKRCLRSSKKRLLISFLCFSSFLWKKKTWSHFMKYSHEITLVLSLDNNYSCCTFLSFATRIAARKTEGPAFYPKDRSYTICLSDRTYPWTRRYFFKQHYAIHGGTKTTTWILFTQKFCLNKNK